METKNLRPSRERGIKPRGRTPLPEMLRGFFWEYDFNNLSWEEDRDLVIERLLAYGTWDAIKWLRHALADRELRDWLRQRRGAGLSRQCLRYWELILDLPQREVNGWLAQPGRQVWDSRLGR